MSTAQVLYLHQDIKQVLEIYQHFSYEAVTSTYLFKALVLFFIGRSDRDKHVRGDGVHSLFRQL